MLKFRHYIGLLIVITLGVAAGNLLSNFLTSQYLLYQAQQAFSGYKEKQERTWSSSTKKNSSKTIDDLRTDFSRLEDRSSIGSSYEINETPSGKKTVIAVPSSSNSSLQQKPSRDCLDWVRAHKQYQTETSKREVARACEGFEELVGE